MLLKELLFPSRCLICKKISKDVICNECLSKISVIKGPVCEICGSPIEEEGICYRCKISPPYFFKARSYALYDGVIRIAIIRFKFEKKKDLGIFLGKLLGEFVLELAWNIDFIVPIPLSKERLKIRGFNQSEVLALEVSRVLGIPMSLGLIRIKETKPSINLNIEERLDNINRAFLLEDHNLKNKKVLLVDDVYTTGATTNEASKTLLERGIKEVRAITLAREL
ncbi:MAG: ComF family protein [bacterium]|nr:ComF family protein [bacterium]